jgi:hypothetical protein
MIYNVESGITYRGEAMNRQQIEADFWDNWHGPKPKEV